MLDLIALNELLEDVTYKDWNLRCGQDESAMWLQWTFTAPDNYSGEIQEQHTRKWRVSRHSTEIEVINTAFLAVKVAVEHEAREEFTYKGQMIYNTHISLDAMTAAAETIETRA